MSNNSDKLVQGSFYVPIKLLSEANISDHWSKKRKRRQEQQLLTLSRWRECNVEPTRFPVSITLVRYGPKRLDDDNLIAAFKWIRDCVADLIKPGLRPGRADESDDISFHYEQRKSKEYKVRIDYEF